MTAQIQAQGEHMSQQEAIESIVESLDTAASSLGPIGDFFEALDRALQDYPDADKLTPAGFMRAYKKAVIDLEQEADEGPGE